MVCADCGMEVIEVVECEVCRRKLCPTCLADHDTVPMPLESVETSVDVVRIN